MNQIGESRYARFQRMRERVAIKRAPCQCDEEHTPQEAENYIRATDLSNQKESASDHERGYAGRPNPPARCRPESQPGDDDRDRRRVEQVQVIDCNDVLGCHSQGGRPGDEDIIPATKRRTYDQGQDQACNDRRVMIYRSAKRMGKDPVDQAGNANGDHRGHRQREPRIRDSTAIVLDTGDREQRQQVIDDQSIHRHLVEQSIQQDKGVR